MANNEEPHLWGYRVAWKMYNDLTSHEIDILIRSIEEHQILTNPEFNKPSLQFHNESVLTTCDTDTHVGYRYITHTLPIFKLFMQRYAPHKQYTLYTYPNKFIVVFDMEEFTLLNGSVSWDILYYRESPFIPEGVYDADQWFTPMNFLLPGVIQSIKEERKSTDYEFILPL